jgi:hypothetical protein
VKGLGSLRTIRTVNRFMNPEVIRALQVGAMDALRLYLALLTAPYHIGKAFVTRPSDEPFHWSWDNRLQPRADEKSGDTHQTA